VFLSKARIIILFKDHKVRAVEVFLKKGEPEVGREIEKTYTLENLAEVLDDFRREFKISSVRVLLPEEKSYLRLFDLPLGSGVTRGAVLEKMREVVPEPPEEGYFDWKQVGADKRSVKIQALVVSKEFLTSFQKEAQRAKLSVEAFESPSSALARLTDKEEKPHLILYQNERFFLFACFKGNVYGVLSFQDESELSQRVEELAGFVKEKWGLEVEKEAKKDLDPVMGLALKEDIKGKDENVLNLKLSEIKIGKIEKKEKKEEKMPEKPKKSLKKIKWALLLLGLGLIIVGASFFFFKKGGDEVEMIGGQTDSKELVSPTQNLPSPTPTIERKNLKIRVLNGSGVAGKAGEIKDFLQRLGYQEIETANADSYDYEETKIAIKKTKEDYLEILLIDLEDYAVSSESSILDEESEFDVEVTIGQESD